MSPHAKTKHDGGDWFVLICRGRYLLRSILRLDLESGLDTNGSKQDEIGLIVFGIRKVWCRNCRAGTSPASRYIAPTTASNTSPNTGTPIPHLVCLSRTKISPLSLKALQPLQTVIQLTKCTILLRLGDRIPWNSEKWDGISLELLYEGMILMASEITVTYKMRLQLAYLCKRDTELCKMVFHALSALTIPQANLLIHCIGKKCIV